MNNISPWLTKVVIQLFQKGPIPEKYPPKAHIPDLPSLERIERHFFTTDRLRTEGDTRFICLARDRLDDLYWSAY